MIRWMRRDAVVLLLYLALTGAFTWPLATNLGDNWLAIHDTDTFVKLWDQWWLSRTLATGQPLFYTHDLFYPVGLDLSYHSISWVVAPFSWLLTPLLGPIDAYNITIPWAIFSSAYAAYLLIHYLLHNRTAAFVGGFIYSFSPYFVTHAGGHPDLVHLAPVPLAALLLLMTLRDGRSRWGILATAVVIAIGAYTSLYIMVFTLLTLGPIFIFAAVEDQCWRTARFWRNGVWIAVVTAVLLSVRLWAIFATPQTLDEVIEAKYAASLNQTDLLALVTPSHLNPVFAPLVEVESDNFYTNEKWPAYLGVVPLLLLVVALTRRRKRPEVVLWFSLWLIFLLLAAGPILRFNGERYRDVELPASLLSWFPPIRAVGTPDYFVLGLLLPMGILAAYGFDALWQQAAQSSYGRRWRAVLLLAVPLLIFELWNGPFPGMPATVHPFYQALAQEPERFALIELPLGRQAAKPYVFYQTVHEKPMVEGLSARTPDEAYRYIEANPLLHAWQEEIPLDCDGVGRELDTAVTQLIADNFRYVILHNQDRTAHLAPYFAQDEPLLQDDELTVYDLREMAERPFCP
ncbi:MAG: hypothetical protein IPM53_30560 [Anaerolineaceae bacterium]|nr:hypothetical protein [Anaerolineaceae bacterium]